MHKLVFPQFLMPEGVVLVTVEEYSLDSFCQNMKPLSTDKRIPLVRQTLAIDCLNINRNLYYYVRVPIRMYTYYALIYIQLSIEDRRGDDLKSLRFENINLMQIK